MTYSLGKLEPSNLYGVELGVAKHASYTGDDGEELFWRAEHVTVYYREPRATVVSIIAPCFEYDVVVLHAEGANAGEEAISNLYAKIDRVLFSRQRPWHPVLVLGDFNARDGSVESRHAGGHQRDRECKAGARSHLQAHCMCACMHDSLA